MYSEVIIYGAFVEFKSVTGDTVSFMAKIFPERHVQQSATSLFFAFSQISIRTTLTRPQLARLARSLSNSLSESSEPFRLQRLLCMQ